MRPRVRTARQMARPSAPAIGASPAAYTSVTNSTSHSLKHAAEVVQQIARPL